jgi:hypothetical protein
MRRAITICKSTDTGVVSIRSGEKVLGAVGRLEGGEGASFEGNFTHTPAYADFADLFAALARAQGPADAMALHQRIEEAGVVVWHGAHDMRIDKPGTLTISGGRARFLASDTFIVMRTGGLG